MTTLHARLLFVVNLPFSKTWYSQLNRYRVGGLVSKGNGTFDWTFLVRDLSEILKIVGKPVEFSDKEVDMLNKLSPPLRAKAFVEEWKGKDDLEVIELPESFVVVTHQKVETASGFVMREVSREVSKALVAVVWTVLERVPLFKPVRSVTVQKNILEFLGITRFHRETGSFDEHKFFGNRKDYNTYFYLPIKVLHHYGAIKHHRVGCVERLKDDWVIQSALKSV